MRNDARKMPSLDFYAWRKVGGGLPQSDARACFRLVWLIAHRPQPPREFSLERGELTALGFRQGCP